MKNFNGQVTKTDFEIGKSNSRHVPANSYSRTNDKREKLQNRQRQMARKYETPNIKKCGHAIDQCRYHHHNYRCIIVYGYMVHCSAQNRVFIFVTNRESLATSKLQEISAFRHKTQIENLINCANFIWISIEVFICG